MKRCSYWALSSSPLRCRGESPAIQDNIFKCPKHWAFQQSTAIFIVSELLLLCDSLQVFSELSQFLPMQWRSAPTPALSTCSWATWRLSLIVGVAILTLFPFCIYSKQVLDSNQDLLPYYLHLKIHLAVVKELWMDKCLQMPLHAVTELLAVPSQWSSRWCL